MTHAHITSWALALILFIIALFLHKAGKAKGFKILQMILRVFYLLILGTGLGLLYKSYTTGLLDTNLNLQYILKAVAGLWIVGLFEMILGKVSRNQSTKVLWIQFIVAFALALYLGFKLPLGF